MPMVTLTFDNGPDAAVTPLVLDVLRRRAIAASFFVIGARLRDPALRALAERAHAEGHWIGNHTYSHAGPLGDRRVPGHAVAEIGQTQALLGRLAHPDRLFRPVGGGGRLGPHLLSEAARDHLAAEAHTMVLWSAVPGDWRDADGWPARGLAQCLDQSRPLLVLHDIPGGAMRHLDAFLGRLADAGATFRQDFPAECVPMNRGVADAGLAQYVMPEWAKGDARCPAS
ncbi:polysaccharide deacetylase family protein [Roseomonas arctica]|uniref:Chitooligosaccharide deacetylase n=1 Tax=Plastoroseomonas arctica TaxID=1509237 RepID=A0AAF1JZ99_9PROT|nr:polysaccharide deacetylase family protein [Plastoroseomonas arctica]